MQTKICSRHVGRFLRLAYSFFSFSCFLSKARKKLQLARQLKARPSHQPPKTSLGQWTCRYILVKPIDRVKKTQKAINQYFSGFFLTKTTIKAIKTRAKVIDPTEWPDGKEKPSA